jgi:hypothetical protein
MKTDQFTRANKAKASRYLACFSKSQYAVVIHLVEKPQCTSSLEDVPQGNPSVVGSRPFAPSLQRIDPSVVAICSVLISQSLGSSWYSGSRRRFSLLTNTEDADVITQRIRLEVSWLAVVFGLTIPVSWMEVTTIM